MDTILTGPRAIDAALLMMGLEAAWYASFRRRGGSVRGGLTATLAAGGFLLLALRASLAGAAWQWIGVFLLAALTAHLLDLTGRIRSGTTTGGARTSSDGNFSHVAPDGAVGRWKERA